MKRLSFLLAALTILTASSYAQDGSESHAVQVAEGSVSSVDWVGAVITVNDMMIYVPPGTAIHKGGDSIGLDEINLGDPVTVTYYDDSSGAHRAVNIIIQYSGDFAV
jgi:hypothetical protein